MTSHSPHGILPQTIGEQSSFVRLLSGHERLLYLYSQQHPRHFCVVGAFECDASVAAFCAALHQVQASHPILNVDIHDTPNEGPAFFTTSHPLTITVALTGLDWQKIVEAELATGFPTQGGPLIRATLLAGKGRTAVVLTIHHAIADAIAGAVILEELMQVLSGAKLQGQSGMESLESRMASLQCPSATEAKSPADIQVLRDIGTRPLWRPFEGDRPRIFTEQFDRAKTALILAASRRHGTTMHGALCAAIVTAVAPGHPRADFTMTCPVNMRAMLRLDPRAIGLFVGVSSIHLPTVLDDFWTLAKLAVTGLAPARDATTAFQTSERLESIISPTVDAGVASGLIGSFAYDAVVSNLGRLPISSRNGGVALTAFWGPFVQGRFLHERVIGAATLDGVLRITQSSPAHIPSLLASARDLLLAASAA